MKRWLCFCGVAVTLAAQAQGMSVDWVAGHAFRVTASSAMLKPAPVPRELPRAGSDTLPPAILRDAEALAQSPHRVTLALIEKGQVVFQYRRPLVRDDSLIISYSTAKSLTAMAVGHALCAGHIKSLDDRFADYVPDLADTVYGRSSVRNLLNMASGANASGAHGEPYDGFSRELRDLRVTYREALAKYSDAQSRLFSKLAPGQAFDYKNVDTAALSLLVEQATGRPFDRWFEETIVPAAGLARASAWMRDRDGRAVAHGFFFATPDDWLRLGLYSLDAYQGRAGDCMRDFMRKAVHDRIRVYNNADATSYGYQFWTGMPGVHDEVFRMLGYGGQYIFVDPRKERVLVAASTQPEASVMRLFRAWVNAD